MSYIKVEDLSLGYDSEIVCSNINFEINKNDYLCIIGENGAGKSTLIKTILDLKEKKAGKILFSENLKKSEIGYLPQQTVVQKDFPATVYEVVLSGMLSQLKYRPFYTKKEKKHAKQEMEKLGITHLQNKSYRQLSGGQQQRVLLARALCASDKIILLDEPVTGLDPQVTQEFYGLLKSLNEQGMTIVMVSHDLSVLKYATHVLYLKKKSSHFYGKRNVYEGMERRFIMTNFMQHYNIIFLILCTVCFQLLEFNCFMFFHYRVTLVLKRFSFIGDGLSHVAFGAMAVATVLQFTSQTLFIMIVTVIAAIFLLRTGQNTKIKGDSSIAMLSVGALAIGYLVMNIFSTSANVSGDVCSTLFGSTTILTLTHFEVVVCIVMSLLVVLFYVLFYNRIFAVTFDEEFMKATGKKVELYNLIIAVLTAVIIVLAMNLVGSLLITALLIFPALSAMKIMNSFKGVVIYSAILSVIGAFVGIILSILFSTPVGATVVFINIMIFIINWIISIFK